MNRGEKIVNTVLLTLCLLTVILIPVSFSAAEAISVGQGQSDSRTQTNSNDEEEIRRVVTDSQFNEMLIIYVNPATFDRRLLTKYWVPENKGGEAMVKVQSSVRRLLNKRWHYDKESANEQFTIRNIKIFPPGDVAEVRTRERWYVPMVDDEERLVMARSSVLEFSVEYRLLKVDGRWLVQNSSGPYREN